MKKTLTLAMVALSLWSGNAIAGKKITGTGATVELACWDYNKKANAHARTNGSCWGTCKPGNVTEKNGVFKYTFSNPNHAGSCPKKKYDGGSGLGDDAFAQRYPHPGGSQGGSGPQQDPGNAGTRFQQGYPHANYATLWAWNTTSAPVQFHCRVWRRPGENSQWTMHAERAFVLAAKTSTWQEGFHQFEVVQWRHECNR
jgi:hypothetical protein